MSEKEELRRKILDTAKTIITEEGYEVLSMRKIAAKIDYSAGILYHYFKDKREIAEIISKEYMKEIDNELGERSDESPEREFFIVLKKYISLIVENPKKYGAVFDMKITPVLNATAETNPLSVRIEGVLTECIEKGIFRKLDTKVSVATLLMMANGIAIQLINENGDGEYSKKIIDHFLYIIFKGMLK